MQVNPLHLCGWGVWKDPETHDLDATRAAVEAFRAAWQADPDAHPGLHPRLRIIGGAAPAAGSRSMLWEQARKVLGRDTENYPQEVGDCFPADTMVLMADGTEKAIQEVRVGDEVVTHKNRARRVLRTIKKEYSGQLLTVRAKGCRRTLTSTPDHRYVHASSTGYRFKFGGYAFRASDELAPGDRLLMPFGVQDDIETLLEFDGRTVPVDARVGRLFGWYLAEGGLSYKGGTPVRVDFSLGAHEVVYAEEIVGLLDSLFGVTAKIVRMPSKPSVITVRANDTRFAKFVKAIFPGNVYSKRVPGFFFRSSRDTKLALLRGWFDGDGHVFHHSLRVVGVSASGGLVDDMFRIALSCGLRPKSATRRQAAHQRVASSELNLYGDGYGDTHPEDSERVALKVRPITSNDLPDGIAVSVREVTESWMDAGHVYCLEVEEEHTFVANGFAVSNCVSFGAKNAVEYVSLVQIALGQTLTYNKIFTPYLWGCGRIFVGQNQLGREDGSMGVWQANAVMQYGAVGYGTTLPNGDSTPEYSGSVARQWGNSPGPAQEWVDLGKTHLVKSAALVQSWEDALSALTNGYPVTVASNVGFDMTPRSDGFNHYSTHWGHQMAVVGIDDGDGSQVEPHVCILNSWGDVHGSIKDFRTGDTWPVGTLRVRKDDFLQILSEGDSFAYSSFDGFPAQALPRPDFDPW